MMSIFDTLILKYPGVEGITYHHTKEDGSAWSDPYEGLVWENKDIAKPTKKNLRDWAIEFEAAYQQKRLKDLNKDVYEKLDEIDLKSIRALRTGDTERLQQLEAEAVELRSQLVK